MYVIQKRNPLGLFSIHADEDSFVTMTGVSRGFDSSHRSVSTIKRAFSLVAGYHGNQPDRHPRLCAAASRKNRPKDRVPRTKRDCESRTTTICNIIIVGCSM